MKIRCPHCKAGLTIGDEYRGRKGRCPSCKQTMLIEEQAETGPGPAAEPAARGVAAEPQPTRAMASRPAAPAAAAAAAVPPLPIDDDDSLPLADSPYAVAPARSGGAVSGVDMVADLDMEDIAPPEVFPPRAGEEPRKSRRQLQRELQELREDGDSYLLKIRVLLLSVGVLMVVTNVYLSTTVTKTVETFRHELAKDPRSVVGLNVIELINNLRATMILEVWMYGAIGVAFCVLAAVIQKFPRIASWAAFGSYVGAWVIDYIYIQTLLGNFALMFALFNLGTLVKIGIIAGLWYGVQVGTAYQEQVIDPMRELEEEDEEEDEDDEEEDDED